MALDIEAPDHLIGYLRDTNRIPKSETPRVRILAGGVSNRTVLVERENGIAWVVKQALEKLRTKADWFSSPMRIHREALGLKWLCSLAPQGTITPLVFEDHELHLLAMEAVPQPHENWKTLLLKGEIDLDHIDQFATLLGMIQRRSHERRSEFSTIFSDVSFFETLRLEPYYAYSAQQVPDAAPFLNKLIEATRAERWTIVHGDYSPKNVLVYKNRLVLLDHEVIHFGDGAFDVGFSLTHLLSKAHHLPKHREKFREAAQRYWQTYTKTLGTERAGEIEGRCARHTLACLLARAAGRSPLEYLNDEERSRQKRIVVDMMGARCASVSKLIEEFVKRCG
ncbi:MAG TPA: phosphotransferase [Planctomycetota bacterium]|nr:phosphotransferase [Planctomycetota bacterium]